MVILVHKFMTYLTCDIFRNILLLKIRLQHRWWCEGLEVIYFEMKYFDNESSVTCEINKCYIFIGNARPGLKPNHIK